MNERLRAYAEAKLAPLLRRVLPLDDAAKLAEADVSARLADVPAEQLVGPAPAIATGVVEALQTRADEPTLRALFAELLASACRADRADGVHVAFVEVLRRIDPDDARVLAWVVRRARREPRPAIRSAAPSVPGQRCVRVSSFEALARWAGNSTPARGPLTFGNLERLGLPALTFDVPDDLLAEPVLPRPNVVELTPFGAQFAAVCLGAICDGTPHDAEGV